MDEHILVAFNVFILYSCVKFSELKMCSEEVIEEIEALTAILEEN